MANEEALPTDDIAESQREPRAIEASFLVDGQTKIVAELKDAILTYERLGIREFGPHEPVALSALVQLEADGERSNYFIGPKAGGVEIEAGGEMIFVLTPQSPLGRNLLGRNLGDSVPVEGAAGRRTLRITAIS